MSKGGKGCQPAGNEFPWKTRSSVVLNCRLCTILMIAVWQIVTDRYLPNSSPMSCSPAVISVHDQIASRLRSDVRRGVFAPGDPLREEHLAARFGVSRSPIRQVLQQLTFEGLLHSKPNCGMVVAEPPSRDVASVLYDCRAKLECLALRQCFHELNESDFQRWEAILDALYDACDRNDHSGAYHLDSLFHRVLIDKASPAGSLGVYSAIAGATSEFLALDENRPFHADFRELYGMHAALYAMFRLGDLEIACEALSQHIRKQAFVAASCRRWTEAGKPRVYEGIYDKLAQPLRRAVTRRKKPQRERIPSAGKGSRPE